MVKQSGLDCWGIDQASPLSVRGYRYAVSFGKITDPPIWVSDWAASELSGCAVRAGLMFEQTLKVEAYVYLVTDTALGELNHPNPLEPQKFKKRAADTET